MTNVNATVTEVAPLGGASNGGFKVGYLNSAAKAAQGDTVTVTNADGVEFALLTLDASGAHEPNTVSTNVITLPTASNGNVSGFVYYR